VHLGTTTVVRLEGSLAHDSVSTCWISAGPYRWPGKNW
jgi:hypothetical protein